MSDVKIVEINGATFTKTTLSGSTTSLTGRYCTADDAQPALNNPIPIPDDDSIVNLSYMKQHCLELGGSYTNINNIKWYTDGDSSSWVSDLGTSGQVWVATSGGTDSGVPTGSYVQADGTVGTSGQHFTDATQYDWLGSSQAFNYVEGSKLDVDLADHTSPMEHSRMVITQLGVGSGAVSQQLTPNTYTWQWDEVG